MAEVWPKSIASGESSHTATVRTHNNTTRRRQRHRADRSQTIRFAHPAETVIARLFDTFDVRWLYEPTTFPLITSQSGLPVQSFTPDFFLPDQNVYIEMTTMRQSLVTRKNRKFRLMRELYPDLNVRLLYRKDVELIMDRYVLSGRPREDRLGAMVAVAEHVDRKAEEIAARLSNQASHPLALVALGRGAESIRDAIAAAMSACGDRPSLATATMRLGNESRHAEWHISSEANLSRSHCVLVADVIGTGLTVDFAQRWLEGAGIPVRQIVTLFDRRSARLIDVPLAVPGLLAPSNWIVGAGLGGNQFAGLAAAHILAS